LQDHRFAVVRLRLARVGEVADDLFRHDQEDRAGEVADIDPPAQRKRRDRVAERRGAGNGVGMFPDVRDGVLVAHRPPPPNGPRRWRRGAGPAAGPYLRCNEFTPLAMARNYYRRYPRPLRP